MNYFRIAKFFEGVCVSDREIKFRGRWYAAGCEFRTLVSVRCDAIDLRMRGRWS